MKKLDEKYFWNGMYFLSTNGFMYQRIFLYCDRTENIRKSQDKFDLI